MCTIFRKLIIGCYDIKCARKKNIVGEKDST